MGGSSPSEVRAILEHVRQSKEELDRRHKRLEYLENKGYSSGIPTATGGGVSNPTARTAEALMDLERETAANEADLMAEIEECRALCEGIRRGLGAVYGDLVEDYYVRAHPWKVVATINGMSVNAAMRKRDVACEWVSDVGMARAVAGEGRAYGDRRYTILKEGQR